MDFFFFFGLTFLTSSGIDSDRLTGYEKKACHDYPFWIWKKKIRKEYNCKAKHPERFEGMPESGFFSFLPSRSLFSSSMFLPSPTEQEWPKSSQQLTWSLVGTVLAGCLPERSPAFSFLFTFFFLVSRELKLWAWIANFFSRLTPGSQHSPYIFLRWPFCFQRIVLLVERAGVAGVSTGAAVWKHTVLIFILGRCWLLSWDWHCVYRLEFCTFSLSLSRRMMHIDIISALGWCWMDTPKYISLSTRRNFNQTYVCFIAYVIPVAIVQLSISLKNFVLLLSSFLPIFFFPFWFLFVYLFHPCQDECV